MNQCNNVEGSGKHALSSVVNSERKYLLCFSSNQTHEPSISDVIMMEADVRQTTESKYLPMTHFVSSLTFHFGPFFHLCLLLCFLGLLLLDVAEDC